MLSHVEDVVGMRRAAVRMVANTHVSQCRAHFSSSRADQLLSLPILSWCIRGDRCRLYGLSAKHEIAALICDRSQYLSFSLKLATLT